MGPGSALAEPVIGPAKGRTRWLACPERRNLFSDSNVKQQLHVCILAAGGARGLRVVVPQTGGSRECRMHAAPAVSCAKLCKKCAHEHTGQRRRSDIPCAMALRLIARSPRRIGLCCCLLYTSPSPRDGLLSRMPS